MPNTHSIDYTDVALYQDHLINYRNEVFTRTFFGFPTANLVRSISGVKGIELFTELSVAGDLIRQWSCDQTEVDNVITPEPVELIAPLNGVTLKICPQDIEVKGYLSSLRRKGQDPDDFPLAAFLMEPSFASMQEQMEYSIWQAKKLAVVPANAVMQDTFDGYLEIARKASLVGKATVVLTGALTDTNILAKMDDMYNALHKSLKRKGTTIFVSFEDFEAYKLAFMTEYKGNDVAFVQVQGVDYQGIRHRLNSKVLIVPCEGIPQGKMLSAPPEFLLYGFDGEGDAMNWKVQRIIRTIHIWADLRFGAGILLKRPGFLVING